MATALSLRERNRVRTRNEILDAAAILLGETSSSSSFSVEEISQRAGVSRGTIYAYFAGGRDEVITEVYMRAATQVRARAELLRSEQIATADRIGALARGFLETAAQPEGRFYGSVRPEVAAIVADHLGSTSGRITELIQQDLLAAQKNGLLDALDSSMVSTLLEGAIRAAGERAAREPHAVESLLETIRSLVTRALIA